MGISLDKLGPLARQQAIEKIGAQEAKKPKYGNKRTPYRSRQGFSRIYDSGGEARYASILDQGIDTGLIKWWLPQVTFPLPGKVSYRADFLIVWADGRISVQDFKGFDTQESRNKRKQVLDLFGVDVELVRK